MLVATVLGSALAGIDATVVNVALPTMGRDLGAGFAGLQWTVNAYTLTVAALILAAPPPSIVAPPSVPSRPPPTGTKP